MEKSEISRHEVQVAKALQAEKGWIGNAQIVERLKPVVSARTVRLHTMRLVKLGLLDMAEVFPAHRFRWSEQASKRNRAYVQRLEKAAEVMGL